MMSQETKCLQTNITKFSANARILEQHLEHLQLESQLERSTELEDSSSGHWTSALTDSLLIHETSSVAETDRETEESPTGLTQGGKCACCLFTVSIASIIVG